MESSTRVSHFLVSTPCIAQLPSFTSIMPVLTLRWYYVIQIILKHGMRLTYDSKKWYENKKTKPSLISIQADRLRVWLNRSMRCQAWISLFTGMFHRGFKHQHLLFHMLDLYSLGNQGNDPKYTGKHIFEKACLGVKIVWQFIKGHLVTTIQVISIVVGHS